ncbi:DNA polymerase-3 subunit alpha (Gram-positive type) [Hydrogenispora ethanolica]|uniref:DNA polymerase III PolC-type n=1 Tax=Hydrogenispora ethanolica TaxID=1082276 RepID=A0A4R1RTK7_HYDET|nr:PolC-type DNA polymerase III [Hydrogenispora ethanolica]TCL69410.1 DNA polymerase-3 subunit alpha (Gram-positive type) [Hydrogenispora ethanolica]
MSEQYLIKPDNRSLKVFKGIEEVSFSFPITPVLEGGLIQEILVNTKDSSWTITLLLANDLLPEQLAELEDALQSMPLGISKVKIKVVCPSNLPTLQERLDSNWNRFSMAAAAKFPGVNGWLIEAKFRLLQDRLLEVQVRNDAGVSYLSRRHEELAELLQDFVLERLRLEFVVGDFEEQILDTQSRMEQEEAEAIQALLKSAPPPQERTAPSGKSGNSSEIYGKRINAEPIPINQLHEEQEGVVIRGEVCRWEAKVSKTGKKFYLGDLTDYSDSISFKIFPRGEHQIEEHLREGVWITIRGSLQYDPYSKELNLMVSDINRAEPVKRMDLAPEKRIELHLHTKMSAMDATAEAAAAVKLAAQWGHPAIAITDHGVVQAFPEAYQAGKKAGIKVLYGVEGYLVNDGVPIVIDAPEEQTIAESTFVVFDLETTGFNPWKEDLLEIGAVKLQNGRVVGEFHRMIKPGKAISAEIQKLTGITPDMVENAPDPATVLTEFMQFAAGAVLVAHNAQFDVGFIKAKQQLFFDQKIRPSFLDTLTLARSVWPSLKSYRLNNLAKELGLELVNHHRAVDDAACAAGILLKALEKVADRNFQNLNDLNILIKEGGVDHLKTYHIIILAKNQVGLKNLYRLVSDSHVQYFHRHPRIPRSRLVELKEGLLLGAACEAGEFYQALLDGATDEQLLEIAHFYDYLEIQPLANNQFLIDSGRVASVAELQENNRRICHIAQQLEKPVVATCDAHFLHPHEEIYRRILLMGQGFEDADKKTPLYFRTTDEMLAEFAYLGKELAETVVIKNPRWILEQIGDVKPIPEEFHPPIIDGADQEIREMSYRRAKELYGDPLPQLVEDRLEWELKSIIGHGYAVLYLIAHKLVKKSLDDNYLVGSRGSVGSSFVATMCNITEVNPLPAHYRCPDCLYSEFKETGSIGSGYDLPPQNCPRCGKEMNRNGQDIPFATFMGFEGDKEPDIDLNFSGDYQSTVHHYTEELFGKGFVFRAGTITGLAEKMAFGFVKGYMEDKGLRLRQAEINRLVKGCTGVRRSTGQHPGGMVVVPRNEEIYSFTPIQYPANDKNAEWITTHFDFHGALEGRLVKLDILGHDDPTVIRMLQDLTGIDPKSVTMGDPEIMRIFTSVEPLGLTPEQLGFDLGTLGIPEFGTGFVRQMLTETKPTTFSELIYISGLSHGTNVWLGNAQELIKSGKVKLAEVISTRDDIMNYLLFKKLPPKSAFKIMEKVRKGKGLEPDDIKLMKEHQVPDWYIDSCLKIKYMFPKAHAVAYVMMAFRIAYFKVKYPEAYYATYFSVRADEFDADIVVHGETAVRSALEDIRAKGNDATQKEKNLETILEMVLEAILRGIKFLRVDIYRSHPHKFQITPEGLLPPLAALQGLGDNAATYIANAREEGEFRSIEDLKSRARLTSAVIEVLQKHGCLKGMSETDQLELFSF